MNHAHDATHYIVRMNDKLLIAWVKIDLLDKANSNETHILDLVFNLTEIKNACYDSCSIFYAAGGTHPFDSAPLSI
ncbi:MAG: hypothetical protein L0G25_07330 [Psychrobacter sp.]|nr:hypothetical protein [Psychrobacter sp.]